MAEQVRQGAHATCASSVTGFKPDHESDGFVVTFRDIPEAITQGDHAVEAMEMAEDVLISSIELYLEEKRLNLSLA